MRVEISDWTSEETDAPKAAAGKASRPKRSTAASTIDTSSWSAPTQTPAAISEPNPWEAPHESAALPSLDEKTPAHHDAIEKHLDPIDSASARILSTIQSVGPVKALDVSEWHLQDKELQAHEYFILRNGQPVKSLKDLLAALEYIDTSTFDHHVNEFRNDFANWIEDAIGEPARP